MNAFVRSAIGCAVLLALAAAARPARAQSVTATVSPPVVDRWMYPFGSEAGSRATVPAFSSLNLCGTDDRFDDRDSEFLITFQTSAAVETGWPAGAYRLRAVRLILRASDTTNYAYDPTPDSINTFFAPGDGATCAADPQFVPDADAGRPVELFAVAFRNGFTATTFTEVSSFKPGSSFVPPWIRVRNAYPISFDAAGASVDVSNPVKDRVLMAPLAVGIAPSATPGTMPPDGTEFTFATDVARPGAREYLQQSLAQGRTALLVTAGFFAQQQIVGTYPNFYTKEAETFLFPNAAPPALDLDLFLCKADINGDGNVDPDDLADFIGGYFAVPSDPRSDFNRDGAIDPDDLSDAITAYFAGCD